MNALYNLYFKKNKQYLIIIQQNYQEIIRKCEQEEGDDNTIMET